MTGVMARRMHEYTLGKTASSFWRSFLTLWRSLGSSKHAGQLSAMTGSPAAYEKSRSALSRTYTKGRMTSMSPASIVYDAFMTLSLPL